MVGVGEGFMGVRKRKGIGIYRTSTWSRGRLGIVIPWNPDAAVASNVLWRGIAWARGKR